MMEPDHLKIIRAAMAKGGDYADLFIEHSAAASVQIEGDRVERATMGIDAGAGIRLISRFRSVYAFTNEITDKALIPLAENIAGAMKNSPSPDIVSLNRKTGAPWNKIEIDPAGISLDEKVEFARRANDAARKMDKRIKQVRVNYGDSRREIEIANSDGNLVTHVLNQLVFLVHVVAMDGDNVQTGYEPLGGTVGAEIFKINLPEHIAERAVKRALRMLDAPPAPAGKMTVVISSEAGGTMIHEAVGHGLEADLAEEGLSVYTDRIGENIASTLITVVDDSTVPGARGSFAFDDEGVPAQKTTLVERGVLLRYMHSRLSAMKTGTSSTGNGRRENFRHRPITRMTNTMIMQGDHEPESIVRSVEKGLFVKKMGGGQVNTVNGDFVFEVTEGYMIEKGKIGNAVRNATLIGNGPEILKSIDMVGSDHGFSIGTCGKDNQGAPVSDAQPTLRIPEITVGGKSA